MKFTAIVFVGLLGAAASQAATITCLTNESAQCATVASQISVSGSGANLAISNLRPLAFAIDLIYFDPTPDNSITGITLGSFSGTVGFILPVAAGDCSPDN